MTPVDCIWFDDPFPPGPWQPGWCFPHGYYLSNRYRERDEAHRPPISVCIPTPGGRTTLFCIDSHPTAEPAGHWDVTVVGPFVAGQKPDITVRPSIHAVGIWHGWLTNGTLHEA